MPPATDGGRPVQQDNDNSLWMSHTLLTTVQAAVSENVVGVFTAEERCSFTGSRSLIHEVSPLLWNLSVNVTDGII